METVKLTLGPILFHWEAEAKRDFYARIADESPVDTVYLGEVVCSKRTPFFDHHLPDVIERLARAGKTVVLSTLSEVVLPRERAMIRDLCEMPDCLVEINNAAGLLAAAGRPHRIGPMMNVYNEETMRQLAKRGADHFSLPPEMSGKTVAVMASSRVALDVGIEVQIFGRVPLAISARCFHARAHQRSKDECQFVCGEDPDGLALTTLGDEDMLTINGVQTLSYRYLNMAPEIAEMAALGVSHLRIMPHQTDMIAVTRAFADHLSGKSTAEDVTERLAGLKIGPFINGFWHAIAGHRYHQAP